MPFNEYFVLYDFLIPSSPSDLISLSPLYTLLCGKVCQSVNLGLLYCYALCQSCYSGVAWCRENLFYLWRLTQCLHYGVASATRTYYKNFHIGLVLKMTHTGAEHRDTLLVCLLHRVLITHTTAWLNDSLHAILGSHSYRIIKWEETV